MQDFLRNKEVYTQEWEEEVVIVSLFGKTEIIEKVM